IPAGAPASEHGRRPAPIPAARRPPAPRRPDAACTPRSLRPRLSSTLQSGFALSRHEPSHVTTPDAGTHSGSGRARRRAAGNPGPSARLPASRPSMSERLMRLIVLAMLAPSLLLASFAAHAQPAGKVYHVGHVTSVDFDQPEQIELRHWSAFVQALRTLAVYQTTTDAAAQKLGLRLHYVHFNDVDELPAAFAEMRKERDGAILIWDDPAIAELAPQLIDLAVKNRLPTIVDAGRWATL